MGFWSTKKDGASEGSTSPTPGKKDKKNRDKSYGMAHLQEMTSREDPRYGYRIRSTMEPRSNGHFIDMRSMGYPSHHGEPDFIRSRLMGQFQETLNAKLNEGIRKACLHWDDEVLNLENNYHNVLEERNGLKTENKSLSNRVKALEKDVNDKVVLLKEFQAGHMKSSGSRRLAPSSSAISNDFEALERRVRDTVFGRVAKMSIHDPHIQVLLQHEPFLDALKGIMCNTEETKDAENLAASLLEVVDDPEKNGLLRYMMQGVIHDVLHKKIMGIAMPGLDDGELKVLQKVYEIIALSEGEQGMKMAQQWRAETYRRLAYWTENVDELAKHAEVSPAIGEVAMKLNTIVDGAEKEIFRILAPFCDKDTPEGEKFSLMIVDIVDKAFEFSILIGSQNSRYELHRNDDNVDDFKAVPEHLEKPSSDNAPLFYAVPALIKTSGEDGEAYEVSELLTQGKIYVLFGIGEMFDDLDEDEETEKTAATATEKPSIKMASPLNGEDVIEPVGGSPDLINKEEAVSEGQKSEPEKVDISEQAKATEPSTRPPVQGADTLPNESNPSMTERSEIIVHVQELIVMTTCKDKKESSEDPATLATTETNGATATTTSGSNGNAITQIQVSPSKPEAETTVTGQGTAPVAGLQAEASTTTSQGTPSPENPEPQLQCIPKTASELLEASLNSKLPPSPESKFQSLEAHLTESPASQRDNPVPPAVTREARVTSSPNPETETKQEQVKEEEASGPPVTEQVASASDPVQAATAKTQVTETSPTRSPTEEREQEDQGEEGEEESPALTPSSTPRIEITLPTEHELSLPALTSSSSSNSVVQSTPRTLPAGPVSLLSNSDSKTPVATTEAVGVETVVQ
ncbi:hypothetical protein H072_2876 [Dactylellina haptotyla CBS 200.50]|uniref:Uncharacterized protein n=1 Tax=Dactylellina haptotyla (strain CBS 200.50) TaxID=1284197 RepID=S8C607_DACHA|nr:hypothetical protein H072_2876 [Dactylellina haptotyla CBS 200.50]